MRSAPFRFLAAILRAPLRRRGRPLSRALRSERGSMTAEAALVLPLLIWAYIASYQFFDAFRERTANLRAAYTVSDMLSRRMQSIDTGYIEGLGTVFNFLTQSAEPGWIRVSSVAYDSAAEAYVVRWSHATGGHPAQTDSSMNAEAARLPLIAPGDTLIVVETRAAYQPIFDVGLEDFWYENFVPTRPRFAACLPMDNAGC